MTRSMRVRPMRKLSCTSSPTVRRRRLPKCSYSSSSAAIVLAARGQSSEAASAGVVPGRTRRPHGRVGRHDGRLVLQCPQFLEARVQHLDVLAEHGRLALVGVGNFGLLVLQLLLLRFDTVHLVFDDAAHAETQHEQHEAADQLDDIVVGKHPQVVGGPILRLDVTMEAGVQLVTPDA